MLFNTAAECALVKCYPNKSSFKEIVPLDRITFSNGGGREEEPRATFFATWTFETIEGNEARLTGRLVFPSAELRDFVVREFGAIEDGKQTLERAAVYLAALKSRLFVDSLFKKSKISGIVRYGAEGAAVTGRPHFKSSEAVSLVMNCAVQREADISTGSGFPGAVRLVEGQIRPILTDRAGDGHRLVCGQGSRKVCAGVWQAMLKMRKLELRALRRAPAGR